MAKIDLNAVLDGHDNPRVGDEYEIAPGKWAKLRTPTQKVQEQAFAILEKFSEGGDDAPSDLDLAKVVLDGDFNFDPENAITGVVSKGVQDFFTLLLRTAERLNPGSTALDQQSVPTEA